jgi:hypothetical protein
MPRDFDTSPFFKIVKPRIEGGFDYHALSWAKDEQAASGESAPAGPAPAQVPVVAGRHA